MNGRVILLTLVLLGGGLSWPLKVNAEPPALAQIENTEASSSLPWQFFSSTPGRYIVDLPGTATEQTSTGTGCLTQVPQMAEIRNVVSRVSGDVSGSQAPAPC